VKRRRYSLGDAEHPSRKLAIEVLSEFEDLLAEHGLRVPSSDRVGRRDEACLYGDVYYDLEDRVTELVEVFRKRTVRRRRAGSSSLYHTHHGFIGTDVTR